MFRETSKRAVSSAWRESRANGIPAPRLANDLRRFLDGKPILARPASAPELPYAGAAATRGSPRSWWRLAGCGRQHLASGSRDAGRGGHAEGVGESGGGDGEGQAVGGRGSGGPRRAESESAIATAINEFLKKDLLARASPNNQSGLGSKPDPDLKLRTVLDLASGTISAIRR